MTTSKLGFADADFDARVYALVAHIPRGKVASYGQLAALCGAPRWWRRAAKAMANAPEGLPCHRVLATSGELAPPGVFTDQRERLLEEGVCFRKNGFVDMKLCRFRP